MKLQDMNRYDEAFYTYAKQLASTRLANSRAKLELLDKFELASAKQAGKINNTSGGSSGVYNVRKHIMEWHHHHMNSNKSILTSSVPVSFTSGENRHRRTSLSSDGSLDCDSDGESSSRLGARGGPRHRPRHRRRYLEAGVEASSLLIKRPFCARFQREPTTQEVSL
jgi:hypothetical protein